MFTIHVHVPNVTVNVQSDKTDEILARLTDLGLKVDALADVEAQQAAINRAAEALRDHNTALAAVVAANSPKE